MSLEIARSVLRQEAEAVRRLAGRIDRRFDTAVRLLSSTRGRVIVLGMGKPGYIAQKISASLASTGTPSIYLHPADALHGDIGRVTPKDIVVALSKSGETEEIVRLLPVLKKIGCKLISLAGNLKSQLAEASDVVLDVSVSSEARPLTVVPTTSAVCMLAMGDALTMALVERKKFKKKDFAKLHPGGSIGKRLHLTVEAVMRKGPSNPLVRTGDSMKKVLFRITSSRAGSATVIDAQGRCVGIFTDGDLRRKFKEIMADMAQPVSRYMTHDPLTVRSDELAANALDIFRRKRIDELPVVDARSRAVGLLDVQDLIREGFIL